jgi:3-(3-hydroxy-phenyl)propionate hydroxylase
VFLLGDAAHQMPPFLGQGMCAGIRDAANLAWKLDLATKGLAGDAVLDAYQSEREPHVRALIERAVEAGEIIQTTDPDVAAQRDARLLAEPDALGNRPYPIPPLGPGFHESGSSEPLPRPGRLDDRPGQGFAIVGPHPTLSPGAESFWRPLGLVCLPTQRFDRWLAARDADFALVRPDRYVFGSGRGAADVDALTSAARASLRNASSGVSAGG